MAENKDHSIDSIMARVGLSKNRDWYASKLDGIGPNAGRLQNERFDLAVSYLETHCVKKDALGNTIVDREEVRQQLNSIDFHKPVTLHKVKPGEELVQRSFRGNSQSESDKSPKVPSSSNLSKNEEENVEYGEYFSKSGVPTQRLGITERNETRRCTVKEDMVVLQSHTRGTTDVWSANRSVRMPEKQTLAGTGIVDRDLDEGRDTRFLRRTNDARNTRSVYSESVSVASSDTSEKGKTKTLDHRSGEYVTGGGIQYHIPKRKDCPNLDRHQNLIPSQSQKRCSIKR